MYNNVNNIVVYFIIFFKWRLKLKMKNIFSSYTLSNLFICIVLVGTARKEACTDSSMSVAIVPATARTRKAFKMFTICPFMSSSFNSISKRTFPFRLQTQCSLFWRKIYSSIKLVYNNLSGVTLLKPQKYSADDFFKHIFVCNLVWMITWKRAAVTWWSNTNFGPPSADVSSLSSVHVLASMS